METRNPVDWSIGNEFPSIYNHCGVMVAWSRKTLKKYHFGVVLEKNDPLRENFQNYVRKRFIATPIDVLCSNFVTFDRREIDKIVRCLPDKKFAWLSSSRYWADRPKIHKSQHQTMYSECSRFQPNRFTLGWVISERVNTVRARSKVNSIFGWRLASSRKKIRLLIFGLPFYEVGPATTCYADYYST